MVVLGCHGFAGGFMAVLGCRAFFTKTSKVVSVAVGSAGSAVVVPHSGPTRADIEWSSVVVNVNKLGNSPLSFTNNPHTVVGSGVVGGSSSGPGSGSLVWMVLVAWCEVSDEAVVVWMLVTGMCVVECIVPFEGLDLARGLLMWSVLSRLFLM